MRYIEPKERYDWEPVHFEVADILLLLQRAVMAELVVSFHGRTHWIGVACDYDRQRRMFGDQTFYIDDQEFFALEDFVSHATLEGQSFANISEKMVVIDTQEGNPTSYLELVKKIRRDLGKHRG